MSVGQESWEVESGTRGAKGRGSRRVQSEAVAGVVGPVRNSLTMQLVLHLRVSEWPCIWGNLVRCPGVQLASLPKQQVSTTSRYPAKHKNSLYKFTILFFFYLIFFSFFFFYLIIVFLISFNLFLILHFLQGISCNRQLLSRQAHQVAKEMKNCINTSGNFMLLLSPLSHFPIFHSHFTLDAIAASTLRRIIRILYSKCVLPAQRCTGE